jgi:hypothetical protein
MKWLRAALPNLFVAGVSMILALGFAEIALRSVPALLPAGFYGSSRYQPEILSNVHGSRMIYNKVRYVEREPNEEGFLDVPHARAKPPGVTRIGFFGDSFVEAAQVPLESTFFRRLPPRIADREIEPLAMGISGWGTLHARNAYRVMAPRYDLDVAVYLFVENDLGDNDFLIQRTRGGLTPKAFATLADEAPGYVLEWNRPPGQSSPWYRVGKAFQDRLLTVQVLWSRIVLLLSEGVAWSARDDARSMTARAHAVPDQTDLPSTWPVRYSEHAKELGRRILADWSATARRDGREFFILYVPRGEPQLTGELPISDTWLPWLRAVTSELGILLVDPSQPLADRLATGDHVYDDHWTPAGHEVVATVLEHALAGVLENAKSSQ